LLVAHHSKVFHPKLASAVEAPQPGVVLRNVVGVVAALAQPRASKLHQGKRRRGARKRVVNLVDNPPRPCRVGNTTP